MAKGERLNIFFVAFAIALVLAGDVLSDELEHDDRSKPIGEKAFFFH